MPYRLLHVVVPKGLKERAEEALEESGISYSVVEGEGDALFVSYTSVEEVEGAIERLKEAGLGEKGFISVSSTEALVSRDTELPEEEEEEKEKVESGQVAREEIAAEAEAMAPLSTNFALLTAISAVIATAGIIGDSTAVVIGSMVIAPLIGPAMASSIGTVLGEPDLFSEGLFTEVVGLMVAVTASAAFALMVFSFLSVPPVDILSIGQVSQRASPGVLSIAIAFGAGMAGALSMTTGLSEALVGVMIAVALIPPASTAGVGLALGDSRVTLGSTVLLLVNVISINIAATLTFRLKGYSPSGFYEDLVTKRKVMTRVVVMAVFLLMLSSVLGVMTYDSYTDNKFEMDVREALTGDSSPLAGEEGVTLASFEVDYEPGRFGLIKEPKEVTVSIRYTEELPQGLGDSIASGIEERTGERVRVVIEPREVLVVE